MKDNNYNYNYERTTYTIEYEKDYKIVTKIITSNFDTQTEFITELKSLIEQEIPIIRAYKSRNFADWEKIKKE